MGVNSEVDERALVVILVAVSSLLVLDRNSLALGSG